MTISGDSRKFRETSWHDTLCVTSPFVYPNVYRTLQLSVTLHETSGEFELSAWFSRTAECPHQLTNDSLNEPLVSLVPMLIDTVNIHRYISIVADSVGDSFARSRPLAYFGQLSFRLHCP